MSSFSGILLAGTLFHNSKYGKKDVHRCWKSERAALDWMKRPTSHCGI